MQLNTYGSELDGPVGECIFSKSLEKNRFSRHQTTAGLGETVTIVSNRQVEIRVIGYKLIDSRTVYRCCGCLNELPPDPRMNLPQ